MSLTLCLAGLQFLGSLRTSSGRRTERRLEETLEPVEERLNRRLTAAMVGLVRSFVVRSVDPVSDDGQAMLSMFNQTESEPDVVVAGVARRLERVRSRLRRDVTLTKTPDSDLEDEGLLIECGWSWGVVRDAEKIDFVDIPLSSEMGYAAGRPCLYFTIVALDCINDLTQPRTRELDLLDAEQRRLADALQLRWDLAQRYWSAMARYDLTRATTIFDELARRGRITSRPTVTDPARGLHVPGVLQAAQLSDTLATRDQLMELARTAMEHLERRAFQNGPAKGLWDDADRYFSAESPRNGSARYSPEAAHVSWYFTERIIECLVAAEKAYRDPPLRSPTSATRSLDLLNEADHLLNQRFLELSERDHTPNRWTLENIEKKLLRARALVDERPGTAHSLCADALRELDELDFATLDAMRGE